MNNIGGIVVKKTSQSGDPVRFSSNFKYFKQIKSNFTLYSDLPFDMPGVVFDGKLYDQKISNSFRSVLSGDKLLEGKWALAFYDERDEVLILTRDPIGICPIYYFDNHEFFAFASTIQLLKELMDSPGLNYEIVYDLLALNLLDHRDETLISGINELHPSTKLVFHLKDLDFKLIQIDARSADYWLNRPEIMDCRTAAENLKNELHGAVRKRIAGLEKIGALLSGGLDSSVISCLINAVRDRDQDLELFTAGFPNQAIDESPYADIVVQSIRPARWNLVVPDAVGFRSDIEDLHKCIGSPTLSAGSYLQFCLLRKARERAVFTVFDGTGADALFAGHEHQRFIWCLELIKQFHLIQFLKEFGMAGSITSSFEKFVKHILKYRILPSLPDKMIYGLQKRFYQEFAYLNKDFLGLHKYRLEQKLEELSGGLNEHLAHDFFDIEVKHLLKFPESCARHFNLELICPFSDNLNLAGQIINLAPGCKIRNGRKKYLLLEAFKDFLPPEIYQRKDKKGLVSPNNQWISELRNEFRDYFTNLNEDVFDLKKLEKDYDRVFSVENKPENYRVFKLISFVVWRKVFGL